MTTSAVEGLPGKYEVLFNGVKLPCFNDTNCPGAGLCAINQTWAVAPGGWCMCNSRAGLAGDDCSAICELGVARIVIGVMVLLLSSCITVVGAIALRWSMMRRQRVADNLNVLNMLLVSLTLGSFMMFVYVIILLVSTSGFPAHYLVVVSQGRELRRNPQEMDTAVFILLVLAQCISVNAPLMLPLVWIDLTNKVFKFRKRSVTAIKVMSTLFCCLVCFVQFPLYVLAASNYQGQVAYWGEIAATIWYVVYGFLILVNFVAAVNVAGVRREVASRPQTETTERFLLLLNRVLITASLLVVFFSILIGLIVGAQARQAYQGRTLYNDPTCNVIGGSKFTLSDICLRLALLCLEGVNAVCLWFILPDTMKLVRSTPRGTNDAEEVRRGEPVAPEVKSQPPQPQEISQLHAAVNDIEGRTQSQSGFGLGRQEIVVI